MGASARSLLLLLSDGRFPAGGHAHSGGVEEAVYDGRIADLGDLRDFLAGRLHTTGLVNAALATASTRTGTRIASLSARSRCQVDRWGVLDAEAGARIASPALRQASRRQGRQLLRAARAIWPGAVLDSLAHSVPRGPHQPIALGATAAAAGLDPADVALAAAQESVTGPATAAVRLLGFDPIAVAGLVAALAAEVAQVADRAVEESSGPARDLPAASAVLIEMGGQSHARREVRLFAS